MAFRFKSIDATRLADAIGSAEDLELRAETMGKAMTLMFDGKYVDENVLAYTAGTMENQTGEMTQGILDADAYVRSGGDFADVVMLADQTALESRERVANAAKALGNDPREHIHAEASRRVREHGFATPSMAMLADINVPLDIPSTESEMSLA